MKKLPGLHLDHLGAKLTTISKKQADYIGVDEKGPFKTDQYRDIKNIKLNFYRFTFIFFIFIFFKEL